MSDLDALLAGIVADPHNAVRWLVMADWLEENGEPERAELVRVQRELLRTCSDPEAFPERDALHTRMVELLRAGVRPCLPEFVLSLQGGVTLKMSFIPPGSFLMGSADDESAPPSEALHPVTVARAFWLARTAVTQAQWSAVMVGNPSHFRADDLPVDFVNWDDARAFCTAASDRTGIPVRLPLEAEWEYAMRAGTTTPFYWGMELNGTQANCDGRYPTGTAEVGPYLNRTTPVGSYADISPHPFGLLDMVGNVWEWCDDWRDDSHSPTGTADEPDSRAEAGSHRAIRGGSWLSNAQFCRAGSRSRYLSTGRDDRQGFRIAVTAPGIG